MNVKTLVEKVLQEKPKIDNFWEVQSELAYKLGYKMPSEEAIYQVLKELGFKLYTPELEKNLQLLMPRRASEILGGMLVNELKNFYKLAKKTKARVQLIETAERGYIWQCKAGKKEYIIKPFQDSKEFKIAPLAAKIGVGPKIFEISLESLVEEFITGPCFGDIDLKPEKLGECLGRIYGLLHKEGILYGDRIIEHLFFPLGREPVLIDYGSSEFSKNFSFDSDMAHMHMKSNAAKCSFANTYAQIMAGLI
jgi:predicted Ser/Thr protein kinase